eukprot:TRINITY_DN40188_c0_g1_i1.p1 TRINITY_DN40188_c0_g1~~TRINITY_DN40188_c0_g1_i1.p1  ORF type:complete len:415 (+),score=87.76 TRINITY_DN40188_c0_g1_i1:141-1385(+)
MAPPIRRHGAFLPFALSALTGAAAFDEVCEPQSADSDAAPVSAPQLLQWASKRESPEDALRGEARVAAKDIHTLPAVSLTAGEGAGHKAEQATEWLPFRCRGACVNATPGMPTYYFLHIPKDAGASFDDDVMNRKRVLQNGTGFFTEEWCFHDMRLRNNRDGREGNRMITFLREPRAHVLSMYWQCTTSEWATEIDNETHRPLSGKVFNALPEFKDFGTWLRHFSHEGEAAGSSAPKPGTLKSTKDFGCYHPFNLQTRQLTCSGQRPWHLYIKETFANEQQIHQPLDEAEQNLKEIFFVGITEHYQASVCLLMIKMGRPLPEFCDCENMEAWASFSSIHYTHGVKKHSIANASAEELAMIDALTADDQRLYRAASIRFFKEVKGVQEKSGVRLICDQSLFQLFENDMGEEEKWW